VTWIKAAFALLQIIRAIMDYLERNRLIQQGERQQFARELAALAKAVNISQEVKDEIAKLSDAEVDKRLDPDFRP